MVQSFLNALRMAATKQRTELSVSRVNVHCCLLSSFVSSKSTVICHGDVDFTSWHTCTPQTNVTSGRICRLPWWRQNSWHSLKIHSSRSVCAWPQRSVFCCCRTTGLELLAGRTATMRFSQTTQTAFKDLPIRDMGPRRFVTT